MSKDISSEVAERFLLKYNEKSGAHKYKMMASFMDVNGWSGFVLKNGSEPYDSSIQAIGAPTIDLWEASWEQKSYTPIKFKINKDDENYNNNGYYIENEEGAIEFKRLATASLEKTGYKRESDENIIDKVYFTESPDDDKNCVTYWIASPPVNSKSSNVLIAITHGGEMVQMSFDNNNTAVRPVVSLSTNLIGNDETSEIYYLGKNIND